MIILKCSSCNTNFKCNGDTQSICKDRTRCECFKCFILGFSHITLEELRHYFNLCHFKIKEEEIKAEPIFVIYEL